MHHEGDAGDHGDDGDLDDAVSEHVLWIETVEISTPQAMTMNQSPTRAPLSVQANCASPAMHTQDCAHVFSLNTYTQRIFNIDVRFDWGLFWVSWKCTLTCNEIFVHAVCF